jgi:hypothetical protein
MAIKKITTTSTPEALPVETNSMSTKEAKNNPGLIAFLVIVIVLLLSILAYLLAGDLILTRVNTVLNTKSGGVSTDKSDDTDTPDSVTISSPTENSLIDGLVLVKGTLKGGLTTVDVSVYDTKSGELIGSSMIGVNSFPLSEGEYWTEKTKSTDFAVNVHLDTVPTSEDGYILVEAQEDSPVKVQKKINIKFDLIQEGKDSTGALRLKVTSPFRNQLIIQSTAGFELLLKGEMKDFFEGSAFVKLLNDKGQTMFENAIQADGDNYSKFSSFEKTVTVDYDASKAATSGKTGKLQFIEVSAKDGSEEVILEIPVYFQFITE